MNGVSACSREQHITCYVPNACMGICTYVSVSLSVSGCPCGPPTLPYRTVPYLHGGQHVVHGGGVGLDDLPAPAQVELQVARHSLDGGRGGMYVWVGECNVCVSECACRSLVPRPGRTAALGSCAGPPTARPARCPPAEQPARPGGSPAHRHTDRHTDRQGQAVTWQ